MLLLVIAVTPLHYPLCSIVTPLCRIGVQEMLPVVTHRRAGIVLPLKTTWKCVLVNYNIISLFHEICTLYSLEYSYIFGFYWELMKLILSSLFWNKIIWYDININQFSSHLLNSGHFVKWNQIKYFTVYLYVGQWVSIYSYYIVI